MTNLNLELETIRSLEDVAERLMDEYAYDEVISLYHLLCTRCMPNDNTIGNLSIAEKGVQIAFRRKLSTLYPQNFQVVMSEVLSLSEAGFSRQALDRCTELLGFETWSYLEKLQIRLARIDSGIRGNITVHLREDITESIQSGNINNNGHNIIQLIAKHICRINHVSFVTVLQSMIGTLNVIDIKYDLDRLLKIKIEELEILREL